MKKVIVVGQPTYRATLHFDKAETAEVCIAASGMAMPDKLKDTEYMAGFVEKHSFGWLGNQSDYYADATKNSVTPKEEDFLRVPFRLITAGIVGGGSWKATDFSKAGILKDSTKMLLGKPVFKDHETDLDNWVGIVESVKWSESFMSNGVLVPAGIDGVLLVDVKTNPKIARGLMLGSIFSNSVTVQFDWTPSHNFDNIYDFYDKIGQLHSDGTMIRRVVTKIHAYHESSLVWLGADPYAKAYAEDGTLKQIDTASVVNFAKNSAEAKFPTKNEENLTEEQTKDLKKSKKYQIVFGIDENVLSLSSKSDSSKNSETKTTVEMNKFAQLFILAFGASLNLTENSSEDDVKLALDKLSLKDDSMKNEIEKLKVAHSTLVEAAKSVQADVTDANIGEFVKNHSFVANTQLEQYKVDAPFAVAGKAHLDSQRKEAIRLYKVATGDKANDAVVAMFEKADANAIEGLVAQYTNEATAKFSGKCAKCGSKDFTFQSSVVPDDAEVETKEATVPLDWQQIYETEKKKTATFKPFE